MKSLKLRKCLAATLVLAILTGLSAGCGNKEEETGNLNSSGPESSLSASGKGRYVETEEALPQELADWSVLQLFTADGRLHLLASGQREGKTVLREYERQENGFADVTQEWLAGLELSCGNWLEARLAPGPDGCQYLYTGYVADGEENYLGHLWKGQGASYEEITPEKWSVPDEQWGSYEMIQGLAALNNGTLAVISYTSLDILSGTDGSILDSQALSSFYEGGIVTDGENTYLRSSSDEGILIEKRKEGKSADTVTITFPTGSTEGGITVGGMGSLALAVLKDGTLIAANTDGIFRHREDSGENQWEKLIEGIDTDFSMPDCSCMDLAALEDGSVYALIQSGETQKLNRYVYDPDAVSEVTQVLKLYTVFESPLLKQAAAMYHKAHPETLITIEYEYPMYYYEQPDYDYVYKKLNTMLMSDDAPDILVMDHLNMDSYAEKGLLADLEDLIRPLEEDGTLLSNITKSYVQEDGKRYAVPLLFNFNIALGRDISPENMSSIEALAEFLSAADDNYMGAQTVPELVDKFYPYFCDKIVREKALDKDAMGKYLDALKAISDNCGIIASHPEGELVYGMWELASKAKLAFNEVGGFTNCMFPMSMVEYIKGSFTAFENSFIPSLQTGICTKSQYMDTARDFLQFALSQQVQDNEYYNGFSVNKVSLQKLAQKDRSQYIASVMIMADDGSYLEFNSEAFSEEIAMQLCRICETLDRPIKEDAKIREVLIECLGGYLDGSQSKEETIEKIEGGLKMYLAE